jgi:hypothetical protein
MTILASTESAISDLESLLTDVEAAHDAITNPQQDDGSSVKKATLAKAHANITGAIAALRGPGSTNAGPSEQVLKKLTELGL